MKDRSVCQALFLRPFGFCLFVVALFKGHTDGEKTLYKSRYEFFDLAYLFRQSFYNRSNDADEMAYIHRKISLIP